VFFFLLYSLFIAYTKARDEFVYEQELNQSQYPLIDDRLDSEFHGNSNLDLVDMPINLTVLEHINNKTIYNNTVKSLIVNQDSSMYTSTEQAEFRKGFCGINSTTTAYPDSVLEYTLPQDCEMPLRAK
jgi:hypothetical protein